jgi:hypothetical protein
MHDALAFDHSIESVKATAIHNMFAYWFKKPMMLSEGK